MRRFTSPRARLFCVCARNRSMRTIARRKVIGLSWRLQESKKRFQWAISPIPRNRKQLSISISGYSANKNADFVLLPRVSHEAKNNLLSQSPDTPRIKKLISFRYLGHSTKPKTTFYLNLRTLHETKNESQFRSPGTMQSEKRISILTSEYSGSKK